MERTDELRVYGGDYGRGGGNNINYYNVDRDGNRIVFQHPPQTKVLLEYKSNGISDEMRIPVRLYNAISSQIQYKLAMMAGLKTRQEYYMEWSRQMSSLKATEKSFTYEEVYDRLVRNYKQSAKR